VTIASRGVPTEISISFRRVMARKELSIPTIGPYWYRFLMVSAGNKGRTIDE
jgi:hypothetical protein